MSSVTIVVYVPENMTQTQNVMPGVKAKKLKEELLWDKKTSCSWTFQFFFPSQRKHFLLQFFVSMLKGFYKVLKVEFYCFWVYAGIKYFIIFGMRCSPVVNFLRLSYFLQKQEHPYLSGCDQGLLNLLIATDLHYWVASPMGGPLQKWFLRRLTRPA